LQMWRSGQEFGNEFRYREDALTLGDGQTVDKPARLEGEYLQVDLVKLASGLGAVAIRATTPGEVRDALSDTRDHDGPVVIVIPAIPHAELPAAGVWWDVAPAEVSDSESVARVRADYEAGLASQRWFG
jgi:3D-(3,5/4)-trihydroxycyclohexane-1,2-dione acylhydrolase (decyclizing)